jgi:alkanesulfonate monooxygenase SsuD/methylene tetrahydromethanopterin reductase-like flavin-dependent oxidoreductase (luciferase family)
MEFGIFHEFLTTQTGSQAEAFAQSFAQIEAAESWGLDVVWLAEIHMNPTRSLLSAPLTVASAIAARTHRIKIGTAVQILPLGHPLQQPHPEIRIAASQHETYAIIGELGYPLFSAVRASPLTELAYHTRAYREAWAAAGHSNEPRAFLQVPIYVAETREAALEDAREGMMRFSTYRADLIRGPLSYEMVLREKVIAGTPEMVVERLRELREAAHLDGVSAEINPGGLLNHQQVMNSLRLYCQQVMAQSK